MNVDWVVSQNKKAYDYYKEQSYESGVYSFYIWATDNDGNSVISDTYHIVFQ